ncbi:MAG: YbbR-like domain-containing protein [Phocaeicola sp.]
MNDNYEMELTIPLKLRGVPQSVVVTEELPSELKVVVVDKGTVLMNYLLGRTFYPVSVAFSENMAEDGSVWMSSSFALGRKIGSQLNQTTKIQSIIPDSIGYVYARGEARKLPVKISGEFSTDRQYYISSIACKPDSLLVYAPKAILDTLTAIYTSPIFQENISDSIHMQVPFLPVKGARLSKSFCDLSLYVDIYAERTVEVPISGLGFPADKMLRTFPSNVQVVFQIGLNNLNLVSADDFFIGIEYEELLQSTTGKYRPHLSEVPHFVNHPRIVPAEIDFLIEPRILKHGHH